MEYKKIKGLNKELSRIVFGCAGKDFIEGNNRNQLLDEVFNLGINTFDTARNYGLSEKSLCTWFKQSLKRDKVILISKCGHPDIDTGRNRINEQDIREDLESSLNLLNTNYIDIYLLHRDDLNVDVKEIIDIMNKLYKEGKFLIFGVSNWTYKRIKQANDYANKYHLKGIEISSPNYCVASKVINPWIGECVSLCSNNEEKNYYRENNMPVFAYSSLGRGFFSGKVKSNDLSTISFLDEFAVKSFYNEENLEILKKCEELAKFKKANVSQIALSYLLNSKLNVFPIISSSSSETMLNNLNALNIQLTKDEMDYLNRE